MRLRLYRAPEEIGDDLRSRFKEADQNSLQRATLSMLDHVGSGAIKARGLQ